jgi:chloramphenicol 3-O-phosphotransferase
MYLHLETDYIFELMENAGYNGPVQLGEPVPSKLALGTAFIHDDWRFVRIEYGEYGVRAFRGFFPMVAALAAGGNHVLVDSFLTEPWMIQGAAASFSQIPAYFVGLRCPLDELERRERERGDRFSGIARAYADAVHAHVCSTTSRWTLLRNRPTSARARSWSVLKNASLRR